MALIVRDDLAVESARGGRFLMLPVLFGIGAILYFLLPSEPPVAVIPICGLLLAVIGWSARKHPLAPVFVLGLGLVLCGFGAAKLRTTLLSTPMLGSEVTTRVTGRVEVFERRPDGSYRVTLKVMSTERPALRFPPDRIRVTGRRPPEVVRIGDRLQAVVRLQSPRGPLRPNGYDFAFQAYFDGIGATGFVLGDASVEAAAPETHPVQRIRTEIGRIRDAITWRIRDAVPTGSGGIAAALISGDRSGIPEDVNEALRLTGLAHVLSISGLHLALVAATVMGSLRAVMAAFPGWASRHRTKQYAAGAAFAAVSLYLLISGSEVATLRSYIMIAVMLAALMADRSALTMRNLAIAALLILLFQPEEVLGPGFQMSFAATAALVAGYGWWSDRRTGRMTRSADQTLAARLVRSGGAFVLGLAGTSVIAGLATGLFAAWHFHRAAPMGLPANLLAMPIVSVVVMPSALVAMLVMPFGLEEWPLRLMAVGIDGMVAIAGWLAAHGPEGRTGFMTPWTLAFLSTALVILVMTTTRLRWAAAPFVVAGVAFAFARPMPVAVVSEDGTHFAAIGTVAEKRILAFNRQRPNGFIAENWRLAYGAEAAAAPGALLTCGEGWCRTTGPDAGLLWLKSPDAIFGTCDGIVLVIQAYAPSRNPCPPASTLAAQDLALKGAAELYRGTQGQLVITHATAGPVRPWTDHRRWSRSARNLAPIERRERAADTSRTTQKATSPAPALGEDQAQESLPANGQ